MFEAIHKNMLDARDTDVPSARCIDLVFADCGDVKWDNLQVVLQLELLRGPKSPFCIGFRRPICQPTFVTRRGCPFKLVFVCFLLVWPC